MRLDEVLIRPVAVLDEIATLLKSAIDSLLPFGSQFIFFNFHLLAILNRKLCFCQKKRTRNSIAGSEISNMLLTKLIGYSRFAH